MKVLFSIVNKYLEGSVHAFCKAYKINKVLQRYFMHHQSVKKI